jgi:ribosomal-protein-alanine N-acetyltransferase
MIPSLETNFLILRAFRIEDVTSILNYASDPELTRYTSWDPHTSEEDSLDFIVNVALRSYAEGHEGPYALCLKDTPEKVIGSIGCVWASKKARAMELQYALSPAHWGQGLMVEASKVLLDHVFKTHSLRSVHAYCAVENKQSERVLQKLEMIYEGCLRSHSYTKGRFWDVKRYSVLDEEWQNTSFSSL